jgi:hypothetical protein
LKKVLISVVCGIAMTFALLAGSVKGQTPPPPPPPGNIFPTIGPPPPINPTATAAPTATATATATATSTPIPLTLTVRLVHKTLAPGKKQKVMVTALAGATVHYAVSYPNKHHKTHNGTIGSSGRTSWSYTQPKNTTTAKSRTASVRVNVTLGTQLKTSKKNYTIGPGK